MTPACSPCGNPARRVPHSGPCRKQMAGPCPRDRAGTAEPYCRAARALDRLLFEHQLTRGPRLTLSPPQRPDPVRSKAFDEDELRAVAKVVLTTGADTALDVLVWMSLRALALRPAELCYLTRHSTRCCGGGLSRDEEARSSDRHRPRIIARWTGTPQYLRGCPRACPEGCGQAGPGRGRPVPPRLPHVHRAPRSSFGATRPSHPQTSPTPADPPRPPVTHIHPVNPIRGVRAVRAVTGVPTDRTGGYGRGAARRRRPAGGTP